MYNFAMIGNCNVSALIATNGDIAWCCLPNPDSEPVFGNMLDQNGGVFKITVLEKELTLSQNYIKNTNIVETIINNKENKISIVDFSPRFYKNDKIYMPKILVRKIIPLSLNPNLKILIQPVEGWNKKKSQFKICSNFLNFKLSKGELKIFSSLDLSQLKNEFTISISKPIYFVLAWDDEEILLNHIEQDCEDLFSQTLKYWRNWVKHTSLPSLFQREVIRSALLLKLHCHEPSGAILASISTSLPEEWNANRNWDYRFCWIRDAYFTIISFYKLGHFEEIISILKFILKIIKNLDENQIILKPVYAIDGTLPLPETEIKNWTGYQNNSPVRTGNQAAEHIQNDVYGEVLNILLLLYCDEKFIELRDDYYIEIIEQLLLNCYHLRNVPDAGIWEIRNNWTVHSFTSIMSLHAIKRVKFLLNRKILQFKNNNMYKIFEEIEESLLKCVKDKILFGDITTQFLDASSLNIIKYQLLTKEIQKETLLKIFQELSFNNKSLNNFSFIYRYKKLDDFGIPKTPFLLCSFWFIEALTKQNKFFIARRALKNILRASNHVGLFAEHFCPQENLQLGNFPQCYSHAGLIHAAFAVSPSWDDIEH
ncbi:glycoside hydrolase family 15 protein [Spirobacillus cienkowskii]|uniref:glycoside hydrolase family 15 protein n=1 Tax=Spirobacillus cienkowskii TaxID=495820 RepID=UPI0030CFB6BE